MKPGISIVAIIFIVSASFPCGYLLGEREGIRHQRTAQIANDRGEYNDGWQAGYHDGYRKCTQDTMVLFRKHFPQYFNPDGSIRKNDPQSSGEVQSRILWLDQEPDGVYIP